MNQKEMETPAKRNKKGKHRASHAVDRRTLCFLRLLKKTEYNLKYKNDKTGLPAVSNSN